MVQIIYWSYNAASLNSPFQNVIFKNPIEIFAIFLLIARINVQKTSICN